MNNNQHDEAEARLRRALPGGNDAPELSPALVTEASGRRAPRLINHGRVLRASGASVAAVAAVTVGALVITLPGQTQGPLFTAASSGGSGGDASMAAGAEASDMRIGIWQQYEYVAGPGLASAGGSGSVYALERRGTPESVLREIGRAFDLEGEAKRSSWYNDSYPSYVLGPEDGSAPSVTISWIGTGNWWYSDPVAGGWWSCPSSDGGADGVVSESADDVAGEECVPPEMIVGEMPTEAEAREQARAIFAATGLDVAASGIRVMADDWQTVASANLVVDGFSTAVEWSVGWGQSGQVAWAYGNAVDAVNRGSFGTVSPRDAVERLSDGRWFGAAGPDFQGGFGIAEVARDSSQSISSEPRELTDPMEPAEPTEPTEPTEPVEPSETEDPVVVDPLPEPTLEPEVVTIALDEATATMLLMWDSEGSAWLVPGYAYRMEEGWFSSVVSLQEGVIQLPEPVSYDIEPMPLPEVKED
jgi:hypothetical protein